MSWHGTLTCTYCYERGHSRRKCPSMKKRHDEYAEALAQGRESEMSYSHRHAYNEYERQQTSLKESNKVCAYCGEHGHRVNTCPERLRAVDALREVDKWWASFIRITFEKYGLGVGTIFQSSGYVNDDYRDDVPHIVTGISPSRDGVGSLSFIGTIDRTRYDLKATNMLTMRDSRARVDESFQIFLFRELFARLADDELANYNFNENYYGENNRQYRDHPLVQVFLGCIPRQYNQDPNWLVSSHSEPFKDEKHHWFDLKTKREINKLFRDEKCKTGLVRDHHSSNVLSFYKILKERGEV